MLITPLFLANLSGAYLWLAVIAVGVVAVVVYSAKLCVFLWSASSPAPVRAREL